MVKADAYGHGALAVARSAIEAGAHGLAVVTLAEAAELAGLLPTDRILVMGPVLVEEASEAAASGFALACSTVEQAAALATAATGSARRVCLHVKLDTGMTRYGASPSEFEEILDLVRAAPALELGAVWTHLAAADSDPRFTQQQFDRFLEKTEGIDAVRHVANSAGLLREPGMALEAVRIGIALYGCEDERMRPVMALRARIGQVKSITADTSVGYSRTWRAGRPSRIATVTIGYADGVHRARSNRGEVLVRGKRAALVGRVSMDSLTIDVTGIPDAAPGDVVTLIGADGEDRITAEAVAAWSGTISYEVLTAVGPRVHRIYLN